MKTVFVIGAGASKEANLPTGSELMDKIIDALSFDFDFGRPIKGDSKISEALSIFLAGRPYPHNMNPFLNAAQHICRAIRQTTSIDRFIDSQNRNDKIELCGKLAIVRTILQAECESHVFVGYRPRGQKVEFKHLEDTWFHWFFRLLIDCKRSDLPKRLESLVLIIFNYDRCIEHYLYYALQNYYDDLNDNEAAQLVSQIKIYHPYGTVGSLPWLQHNSPQTNSVTLFGHTPNAKQLLELTKQIKTFTEGTDESSSDVRAIRSHMTTADKLIFLGFAFHDLNLELLLPDSMLLKVKKKPPKERQQVRAYATAYQISDSDVLDIANELSRRASLVEQNICIRNDLTCVGLIKDYWRSLKLN